MNFLVVFNIIFLIYAFFTFFQTKNMLKLALFNFTINLFGHTFEKFYSTMIVSIVGINIYTFDIFNLLLLALLISKLGKSIKVRNKELLITLFSLVAVASLFIGVMRYGKNSYLIGDIRKFGGLIVPLFYFAKFPLEFNEDDCKTLTWYMRALLTYCYICWISAIVFNHYLTPNGTLRCMGSDYAIVLCVYTLYLVYHDIVLSKVKKFRLETILFIIALVVLQHNSVYTAFALGLAVILIFNMKTAFLSNPKWLIQVLLGGMAVLAVTVVFSNIGFVRDILDTFSKYSDAAITAEGSEAGTIGTRYLVWRRLLATLKNPIEWLIGKPMGTGYRFRAGNFIWDNVPHSGYIEGIMRTGIIGVALLALQVLSNIVEHLKRKEYLFAAVLVAILAYWYAYSYTQEAGLLIGMSIALLYNNVDFSHLMREQKNNGFKIIYK